MTLPRSLATALALCLPLAAHASDPAAPPRPLAQELPVFLRFIELPKRLAQRASDRLLALKCESVHRERRRKDALISEESGAPRSISELQTAEDIALCLLRGSPDPAPASARAELAALESDFSSLALRDFPALAPDQRAELLKPFASTLAPSQGVASDEGRSLARAAILNWQRQAVEAGSADSLIRSIPPAQTLMARSLSAARADRWRWFQAENELPVGLRLALQSPSLSKTAGPDPLRPLSSSIRPLLEELWAYHWSFSRPLENAQRSSAPPSGIPANRAELFEGERQTRSRQRSASQSAFEITPADQELAETPDAWRKAFDEKARSPGEPGASLYRPVQSATPASEPSPSPSTAPSTAPSNP